MTPRDEQVVGCLVVLDVLGVELEEEAKMVWVFLSDQAFSETVLARMISI